MTFMVYWTEQTDQGDRPRSEMFAADEMDKAMALSESLRQRQWKDGDVHHVTFCSENPNSVGRLGVADAPSDYDWKKRR